MNIRHDGFLKLDEALEAMNNQWIRQMKESRCNPAWVHALPLYVCTRESSLNGGLAQRFVALLLATKLSARFDSTPFHQLNFVAILSSNRSSPRASLGKPSVVRHADNPMQRLVFLPAFSSTCRIHASEGACKLRGQLSRSY